MRVLKSINKKILAIFLAVAMVVTGLYVFVPEATEAQAAGSETLFAGYYEDAEKTIPVEVETPHEKNIDAGVLSVKLQMKENADGSYDMRVISSVDSLNYKNVGFEVYYKDATEPIVFETTAVLERISATANVTYQYSPKVINTDSEYFVTGTIKGIAAKNLDANFYIKPFLTTLDGTLVYGQSRYFTVNDGVSNQNINIPVKMDANPGATVSVSVGGTAATAEVAAYKDGYAHLNIPVDNKTTLKSATTITVGTDKAVYRNLLSTGSADTSWYDEYKNDTNEFVIANKADLLGLQEVIKATNLLNTTIYAIADIEVNDVTKVNWDTGVAETGYTPSQWIPIGRNGSPYYNYYFKGTFNGQGHTFSGIYSKTNLATSGLFGYVQEGTVKNLKLADSYFECTGTNATMGSIVGVGVGTFENLYSEATLVSTGQFVGGIVGLTETATGATIKNCQYNGTMTLKGDTGYHAGGILGETYNTYVFISNCLNSGTITAEASTNTNPCIAGIIGYVYGSTNATITDTLNTGSVTTTGRTVTVGAIAGWHNGAGTFTVANTYSKTGCSSSLGEFGDKSKVVELTDTELTGKNGYLNTKLDFYRNDTKDGEWGVTETGTPVLRSFAEDTINLDGVLRAADTSWYDGSGSYIIDEPEELLGLMEVIKQKNFEGETIKLAADITINDLNALNWKTGTLNEGYIEDDLVDWIPVGRTGSPYWNCYFKGTFDGDGHTIRGIYSKTNLATSGLFGYVQAGTVKNLKLVDSYFESTGATATMGSIAGTGVGTFENLYSEATLVSTGQFVGGIVGATETATGATIQNCQYNGTMTLKGESGIHAGGILGETYQTYVSIKNCLNSGSISTEATSVNPCVAGIIGYVYGTTTASIDDCLNVGSVITTGKTGTVGSIAGWHNGSGTFTVTNTYSMTGSSASVGEFGDKANVVVLPQSDLMYAYGYINTDLDFYDYETKSGYWTAVADGTIALKSFAKNKISIKDAIRDGDQSWYNGSGSYTISTPEQLVGFMELAKTNDFSGATITLGADIKMNEGDASTWGINAPKNVWTPIGRTADHSTYARFAGTFDGAGHSISGIYVKSSSAQIGLFGNVNGATIKNLQLTNSYIENTTSAYDVWSGTGSIAGVAYAHLNGVYSDAIVISGADFVGGLLGGLMYNSESTITNSWFDGEVLLAGDNSIKGGGLVGGLTAGKCILTNCLNSGSVTSETVTYGPNIAGLVGYVSSRQVDMTNCLNVGTINPMGNKNSVGSIVAWQTGASTISNVYTLEGCYSSVGEMTGDNEALVGVLPLTSLVGDAAKTSLTGFDFYSESNTTGIWKAVDGSTPILAVFSK